MVMKFSGGDLLGLPAEGYHSDAEEVGNCGCAVCGQSVDETAWTCYGDLRTRTTLSVCGDCNDVMMFIAYNTPMVVAELKRRRGLIS